MGPLSPLEQSERKTPFLLFDRCLFWSSKTFYTLPLLLSFRGYSLCLQRLCSFMAVPQPLSPPARATEFLPKGVWCQKHIKIQFDQHCSKLNSYRCYFCQYYISLWCCFQYVYIIDKWHINKKENSLIAACPKYILDLIQNFFWFPSERGKKEPNWSQWNAVLEPLQPIKLFI